MIAGQLEVQLYANMARLATDMADAKSRVGSAMEGIEKSVESAKKALEALGIGLGLNEIKEFIAGIIEASDQLYLMSQKIGVSVETLASYQLAAKQSGLSIDELGKGIKNLSVYMAKHDDDLKSIGVTSKDTDEALKQLADVFQSLPDGYQKTALAQEIFKKSGIDMIPMLNKGAEGLQEAADKSAAYTEKMALLAPLAHEFNDRLEELKISSGGLGNAIGLSLVPVMNVVIDDFLSAKKGAGDLTAGFDPLGEAAKAIVVLIGNVGFVLKGMGTEIGGIAAQVVAFATGDFAGAAAIGEMMRKDADTARQAFDAWEQKILSVKTGMQAVKVETENTATASQSLQDAIANLLKKGTPDNKEFSWLTTLRNQLNAASGDTSEYSKVLNAITTGPARNFSQATKDAGIELAKQIDTLKAATKANEDHAKALAAVEKVQQEVTKSVDMYAVKQEETIKALKTGIAEIDMTPQERAITQAMAVIDKALDLEIEKVSELMGAKGWGGTEEFDKVISDLTAMAERSKGIVTDLITFKIAKERTWVTGTNQAFQDYVDNATNAATQAKNFWNAALTSMEDLLTKFFMTGKLGFADFIKAIEQQLAKMAAQQIVVSIVGAVGLTTAGTAAAAGTGVSALSSIGSAASSFEFTSLGSAIGNISSAATAFSNMTAAGSTFYEAASTAIAGVTAGSIATLLGGAGLAVLAINKLLSNGGTPTSSTGDNTVVYSSTGAILSQSSKYGGSNSQTDAMVQQMESAYLAAAKQLGIAAAQTTFAFAGNTGKNGQSPNFGLTGGAGGVSFTQGETGVSDAAVQLAAARAVFAALQGSDLPAYLSKLFNGLHADSMSMTDIQNAEAFAATLKSVRDGLTETRTPLQILQDQVKAGTDALHTSGETFKTDFVAAIDAGMGPDQLAQWQALGTELDNLAQQSGTATAAVVATGRSLADIANEHQGLQDQLDNLTMTSAQLLDKQRAALDASNQTLWDQVQAAQAAKTAQDKLTASEQAAADQHQQLQDQLDNLTMTSAQLVDKARNAIAAANQDLFDKIQAAQTAKDAAAAQAAADAQAAAAQQAAASQAAAAAAQAAAATQQAIQQAQQAADQAALAKAQQIASERVGLQTQLDNLTMTATELLAKQRDALDASNQALFDQVQAAQAAKTAADQLAASQTAQAAAAAQAAVATAQQRQSLQDQLDNLTMTPAELLAKQRATIDAANQPLFDQIQTVTAQQAAAKAAADRAAAAATVEQQQLDAKAAVLQAIQQAEQARQQAVTQERAGLQTQLNNLLDTNAQALKRQRDALDGSNQALFDQIQALTAAKAAQTKAQSDLDAAYQRESSALQTVISNAKSFSTSMHQLADSLLVGSSSALSSTQKQAEAQRQFDDLMARLRGGDTSGQGQLSSAVSTLLSGAMATSATQQDYARVFASVQDQVASLGGIADQQVTDAQAQLDALTASVNGLVTVNSSVISVRDAIIALHTAMAAVGAASAPNWTANGSHAGGLDYVPFNNYRAILHEGERVQTKQRAANDDQAAEEMRQMRSELRRLTVVTEKQEQFWRRVSSDGKTLNVTVAA